MFRTFVLCFVLLGGATVSVQGLTCRAGFNASVSGIPFYQWYQDTCAANSKCFGQELGLVLSGFDVVVRYGGCVSSAYSSMITCESLFGADSTLDPADLLDVIPDLEQKFTTFIQQFATDTMTKLQMLFSAGEGTDEFVSGLIQFYENLGFNMAKVKELEPQLQKLFDTFFLTDFTEQQTKMNEAISELLVALGNLDTPNDIAANNLYKFLETFNVSKAQLQASPIYQPMIERLPGLVKSIIPAMFQVDRWYDTLFQILGTIDYRDPKKTTEDAINVIKNANWIPAETTQQLNAIFDSLPELVSQMVAGNTSYINYWNLEMLKAYSENTTATHELSQAVFKFLDGIGVPMLPQEINMLINWLPGYYYQFFPTDRAKIDEVYGKMADGFNSFDFTDLTNTSPATTMSNFTIFLTEKIMEPQKLNDTMKAVIINFSYMFYTLMQPDYAEQFDIFFNTLNAGFQNFPQYNVGQIISDLVVNLGGTVPGEVQPLLDNIQTVINTLSPFHSDLLYQAATDMVNAYATAYPDSSYPALVQGYIDYIIYTVTIDWASMTPQQIAQTQLDLQMKSLNLSIDAQFAMIELLDLTDDEMHTALTNAFPKYALYIQALRVLNKEDVKGLVKKIVDWIFEAVGQGQTPSSAGFVAAVKPTVEKLTDQLGDLVKDIRLEFAPNSCKHNTCDDADDCNTHLALNSATPVTKPPSGVTEAPSETTTSGSGKISHSSVLLNIVSLFMGVRVIWG